MSKKLFWSRDRLIKHKFDCLGLWIASGLWLGFMKNRKIPRNVIFLGERISKSRKVEDIILYLVKTWFEMLFVLPRVSTLKNIWVDNFV